MKIKNSILTLVAGAAVITFIGCSKSETPSTTTTTTTTPTTTTTTTTTTDTAKDMTGKAADMTKEVTGQATAAVAAAPAAATAATAAFTDGIASAKKMIADKDYQGALGQLAKLSSMNLSDAQTKVVDGLKAEVQALISKSTGGAVDAAKGLLGK